MAGGHVLICLAVWSANLRVFILYPKIQNGSLPMYDGIIGHFFKKNIRVS
jgi:hypothetical protein